MDGIGRDRPLLAITPAAIAGFIARRRGTPAAHRDGAFLAPATVNKEITLLRSVLLRARDIHGEALAPERIPWGKLFLEEPDERETILSAAEEARLFEHLRADYWPMVSFAIVSGQRLENIRTLSWKQVDWERRLITFRIKSKKPGGRVHIVPLTAAIAAILSRERGHHPERVFTYLCENTSRYWEVDEDGVRAPVMRHAGRRYPISRYGWRRPWRAALAAAGLSEARFHDLRHTAAQRTLEGAGGNLKTVQRLLGHRDAKTTLRYLRARIEDVRDAMEKTQEINAPTQPAKLIASEG